MDQVHKRIKMDTGERGILDLPNEVLEPIFLMLSQKDIQLNVALVCHRFLEITRKSIFLETVSISLFPNINGRNLKQSTVDRIKGVLKAYPECKLELYQAYDMTDDMDNVIVLWGYLWTRDLLPFASSIYKLQAEVPCFNEYLDDFSDFILLENLECLNLRVRSNIYSKVNIKLFKPQLMMRKLFRITKQL